MQAAPLTSTDSQVGLFTNEVIRLQFDYGWYSDPLNQKSIVKQPNYRRKNLEVDGRRAYIITYTKGENNQGFPHSCAIHFPNLGNHADTLTLQSYCRSTNQFKLIERSYRSIQFKNLKELHRQESPLEGIRIP